MAREPMANRIAEWQISGERGLSSDAVVAEYTMGKANLLIDHPHDPDDLRRCVLLFERVPELKAWINQLAEKSPYWRALAYHTRKVSGDE